MLLKKYQIGDKRAQLGHRDLLFNSGIPRYFWNSKSYKLAKVVNEDNGNLGAEPSLWRRGRPILEGAEEVALSPKLNICIPVSQFCKQFCSRMF